MAIKDTFTIIEFQILPAPHPVRKLYIYQRARILAAHQNQVTKIGIDKDLVIKKLDILTRKLCLDMKQKITHVDELAPKANKTLSPW